MRERQPGFTHSFHFLIRKCVSVLTLALPPRPPRCTLSVCVGSSDAHDPRWPPLELGEPVREVFRMFSLLPPHVVGNETIIGIPGEDAPTPFDGGLIRVGRVIN